MLGTKLNRLIRPLRPLARYNTNDATITVKYNDKNTTQTTNETTNNRATPSTEKVIRDKHLANITVTSFYCQSAIEQYAAKQSTRLTPLTMMYIGKTEDGTHLLRSAQYLQKDLPIRFAHRIDDFRNLPFVVACNPLLLDSHERFIKIFHTLHTFPPIKTLEQEKEFTELLKNTLSCTSDTLPLLVEGFRESKRHIKQETLVRNFLDRALTSRLAIKMLIEHHIAMRKDRSNYIGAICMSFSPRKLVESSAEYVKKVCRLQYGVAPNVKIDGHVHSTFPYIATPLYYIIPEMLKNAFRATVEHHRHSDSGLPTVGVTIAVNEDELVFRIKDRGGGMSRSVLEKIFDYHFSSSNLADNTSFSYADFDHPIYDPIVTRDNTNKMSGYGFGVPTSRAYCEYLNGSLTIETMYGIGSDVYVRVGLLTSENRIVRL
ncbi:unnamed protein product [Rotaria socialis]|uniref:Protein-serine/threonine kinase n=2 Tax=Rotaria socialis TaxID=392032 RepID=A0A817SYE5_9BILA|nr:unnamed protein product [Rotaria socialis]CAF3309792.1 unnamed protein product [Rotaria socialis]CAF3658940.1 unnamed protein product [Rotaria socialis]CAF3666289.1 unnamed protein product [Rotaria socialis]CAF4373302.1 unnamed protein product [Rotaria socialis]